MSRRKETKESQLHRYESVSLASVDVRGIRNRFSIMSNKSSPSAEPDQPEQPASTVARRSTGEVKPVMRRWVASRDSAPPATGGASFPMSPEYFQLRQKQLAERERLLRQAAQTDARTFRFKPAALVKGNIQQHEVPEEESEVTQKQILTEVPEEKEVAKTTSSPKEFVADLAPADGKEAKSSLAHPRAPGSDKSFSMLRGIVARNRALFNGGMSKDSSSGDSVSSSRSSRVSFRRSHREKKRSSVETVADVNERLYRESLKLAEPSPRRLNPFRGSYKQLEGPEPPPTPVTSTNPHFEGSVGVEDTKRAFSMFRRRTTGSSSVKSSTNSRNSLSSIASFRLRRSSTSNADDDMESRDDGGKMSVTSSKLRSVVSEVSDDSDMLNSGYYGGESEMSESDSSASDLSDASDDSGDESESEDSGSESAYLYDSEASLAEDDESQTGISGSETDANEIQSAPSAVSYGRKNGNGDVNALERSNSSSSESEEFVDESDAALSDSTEDDVSVERVKNEAQTSNFRNQLVESEESSDDELSQVESSAADSDDESDDQLQTSSAVGVVADIKEPSDNVSSRFLALSFHSDADESAILSDSGVNDELSSDEESLSELSVESFRVSSDEEDANEIPRSDAQSTIETRLQEPAAGSSWNWSTSNNLQDISIPSGATEDTGNDSVQENISEEEVEKELKYSRTRSEEFYNGLLEYGITIDSGSDSGTDSEEEENAVPTVNPNEPTLQNTAQVAVRDIAAVGTSSSSTTQYSEASVGFEAHQGLQVPVVNHGRAAGQYEREDANLLEEQSASAPSRASRVSDRYLSALKSSSYESQHQMSSRENQQKPSTNTPVRPASSGEEDDNHQQPTRERNVAMGGSIVQQRMRLLEAQSQVERFGSAADPDVQAEAEQLQTMQQKEEEEAEVYRREQERLQELLQLQHELNLRKSQERDLQQAGNAQALQDMTPEMQVATGEGDMFEEQVQEYMQQLAMSQGDFGYNPMLADDNSLVPSFYEQYIIEDEEGGVEPMMTWMSRPLSIVDEEEEEENNGASSDDEDFFALLLNGEKTVNPFVNCDENISWASSKSGSEHVDENFTGESSQLPEIEYESDGSFESDPEGMLYESDGFSDEDDFVSESEVQDILTAPSTTPPGRYFSSDQTTAASHEFGSTARATSENKFTAFLKSSSEDSISDESVSLSSNDETPSKPNKLMAFLEQSRMSGVYDD